jgi:mRNA interferase MazF
MPTSGELVDVDLGVPQGREAGFVHPAVLVTAQRILDAGPSVVQVVPLTSTIRGFHSEIVIEPDTSNGLGDVSAGQCEHLCAVASSRVVATRGNVGPAVLAQLRGTIALILDVPLRSLIVEGTFPGRPNPYPVVALGPGQGTHALRWVSRAACGRCL